MNRKPRLVYLYILVLSMLLSVGLAGCDAATEPVESPGPATATPVPDIPEISETEDLPSLATDTPPPLPAFTSETPAANSLCGDLIGLTAEIPGSRSYAESQFAVEGEVILTGIKSEIQRVIADLPELVRPDLEPIAEIEFSENLRSILPGIGNIDTIALYETAADVSSTVLEFNRAARDSRMQAFSEPNYIFGSPWDVEGSPWDVEGSPWNMATTSASPEAVGAYWDQLAATQVRGGSMEFAGEDARVIVFDTSPFLDLGLYIFDLQIPLKLCVGHPVNRPALELPGLELSPTSEHGLFVVGLVHNIAPGSQIYLLRVLNDDARGDVFTLLDVMVKVMNSMCAEAGGDCSNALTNSVLNLSLGFRPERALAISAEEYRDYVEFIRSELIPLYTGLDLDYSLVPGEMPIPVLAMRAVTLLAKGMDPDGLYPGALIGPIVAAAGNAKPGSKGLEYMDHPAIFEEVLGVAAGKIMEVGLPNIDRACYAHRGDTIFPGGDGDENCMPASDQCTIKNGPAKLACEYGVISLGITLDTYGHYGYGYWAGSSFAAPLASGYIARGVPVPVPPVLPTPVPPP